MTDLRPSHDENAPLDHHELAARVRFSLDEPMRISRDALKERKEAFDALRAMSSTQAVRVTPRLMPQVHAAIRRACENLLVATEPEVYVVCSAEPNAEVVSHGNDWFVRLHSGLVQILEPVELAAVVGHEIGHAALLHAIEAPDSRAQATFALERSRAQEISADRVGLIAAGDATHALRAEIKVACGLSGAHLTTDLDAFIEQISTPPEDHDAPWEMARTHPTLALRFWAQRAFAESDLYRSLRGESGGRPFDQVEREIEERFHATGSSAAFRATADHVHESLAWLGILIVAHDGEFSENERETLVEFVGRIWADDAFAYARRHGLPAVERRAIETLGPLRFSSLRTRHRIESAVREMADRANAQPRLEGALQLIARAVEPS